MRRGGHELMHRRQIGETKQFGGNKKQTTTDLKNIEARKKIRNPSFNIFSFFYLTIGRHLRPKRM